MIDRNKKIYMAYRVAQKSFSKEDPLLANFKAALHVSKLFRLPLLQTLDLIRTYRKK